MDPDTVELGWQNEDDIITDDNRVTVMSHFSVNAVTTIIQFDPLSENDEGTYICYSVVNKTAKSTSIQLQNFRVITGKLLT